MRSRIDGMRAAGQVAWSALGDLLARPGVAEPLAAAVRKAHAAYDKSNVERDAIYKRFDDSGKPAAPPEEWTRTCNAPFAAIMGIAGASADLMQSHAAALESQAWHATEEIAQQVSAIQSATGDAVTAIKEIGAVITEVNDISATIAAAVEQQGAATQEIARNAQQAAAGTTEVAQNMSGVTEAAGKTGSAAAGMLEAVTAFTKQSAALRAEVDRFLWQIRAA